VLRVASKGDDELDTYVVVAAGSDGSVRLWSIPMSDLWTDPESNEETELEKPTVRQLGALIGLSATGNRITCLDAFVMGNRPA
jgi:hypothetical protein